MDRYLGKRPLRFGFGRGGNGKAAVRQFFLTNVRIRIPSGL